MEQEAFGAMRRDLGDRLLAKLLWRSVASVRKYASGRRPVPPLMACRLDWIHRISFDLAGGYGAPGIQAWFVRPRAQLGHRSPLEILGPSWQPTDVDVAKVANLAATLSGRGGTLETYRPVHAARWHS